MVVLDTRGLPITVLDTSGQPIVMWQPGVATIFCDGLLAMAPFGCEATASVREGLTGLVAMAPFGIAAAATESFVCSVSEALPPFGCSALATEIIESSVLEALPVFGCAATATEAFLATASAQMVPFGISSAATESFPVTVSEAMAPFAIVSSVTESFPVTVSEAMAPFACSAAATQFIPTQISGCTLWLRSDLGITLGTGVSAWADQSGNGHNVTQGTGSKQPTYNATGGPNNLPYVKGDGISQFLTGAWTLNQPFERFMVAIWNSPWSAGNEQMSSGGTSSAVIYSPYRRTDVNTAGMFGGSVITGAFTSANFALWQMYDSQFNSGTGTLVIGGSQIATGAVGSNNPGGCSLMTGTSLGAGSAPISIVEVIDFNAILSSSDRANVRTYFQNRYGVP